MKEEKILVTLKNKNVPSKKKDPYRWILLLLCFCIVFSVFFQGGLKLLLRRQAANPYLEESTDAEIIEETALISFDPEERNSAEAFREELTRISSEEESFRRRRSGQTLREQEQQIAEVWDRSYSQLVERITEDLNNRQKETLEEEEKQFRRERKTESMKEVNVGNSSATENVDYLRKYSHLTEEHCYELLEKYLEKNE